jgi:hypothetical protein
VDNYEEEIKKPEKEKSSADKTSDVPEYEDRKKQWKDDDKVKKQLCDIYATVFAGFDDKEEQTQVIERAYAIYNCELNENQMYDGDSKVFLPIVHDAIEARVTRFSNSMFPQTGRYSEVLSNDGKVPYETMAVLDSYVESCGLRDIVIPSLIRSGDITGQYSLFVGWLKRTRNTIKKVQTPQMGDEQAAVPGAGTIPDIEFEAVDDSRPDVMVLDARDLLMLPASVDDVEDADVVAIALRMSKGKIQDLIDSGDIDEAAGEQLLEDMSSAGREKQPNPDKKNLNAAGIKTDSKGGKTALVYMVWSKIKIGGKRRRCLSYMAGADQILSCKRNPYWSDRVPVITQASLKVSGAIWGKSRVQVVEKAQYAANDAFNMGQDSIKYSLMPITVVDPEKFMKTSSLVLTMGAIWLGDPNALKVVQFPSQWNEAERVVAECRNQIMQSLGTNPAMLTMGSRQKPTQAQISQDQQVALESTADVVTILETAVLNKLLRWFYELDYQFRDKDIHVRRFGPVGLQAEMQAVPPVGVDTHYTFKWYGTEGNKSAQQIQQMISMLNVMKSLPPEMLNGRKIDAGPIIEQAANATFGPRVAPKVLIDQSHMLTVSPHDENEMMFNGFCPSVQPMDNDQEHIQSHMQAAKITGDPTGEYRIHIQQHMDQMQQKSAPAAGAPNAALGGPRPGGQVQPPTGAQNPAGAVHPDEMQGAMPRDRVPQ